MELIDYGDLNIKNISYKIEMIKEPGNNQREIQRIQIRLNNYNNKFDHWMDEINNSQSVEPAASALGNLASLALNWLYYQKSEELENFISSAEKSIYCINWAASLVGVIC